MQVYLKIKIKSLGAEARFIRKEERKTLKQGRYWLHKEPPVAAEHYGTYNSLRRHRVFDLRKEARSTYLAYGFLRGVPYERIEAPNSSNPNWDAVQRMVEKYGGKDLVQRS